jgi:hypothetical protein
MAILGDKIQWILVTIFLIGFFAIILSMVRMFHFNQAKNPADDEMTFNKKILTSYYKLHPNVPGSADLYYEIIQKKKWTIDQSIKWYEQQPWIMGCNYIPASAINQLEMWQADSFDPNTIEQEAKLAQSIGFNTYRVFLHDLLWTPEVRPSFLRNVETFLKIVDKYGIKVIFTLFDDCHRSNPDLIKLGKQTLPVYGVHNSGWLQSPGTLTSFWSYYTAV